MQGIYYKVVCATYNSVILNHKTFVILMQLNITGKLLKREID